jgi:oligosaccharide repeat unit polymerase
MVRPLGEARLRGTRRAQAPKPDVIQPLGFPTSHRLILVAGFLILSLLLWIFAISKQPGSFTVVTGGMCFLAMVAVMLPFLVLRDELVASPLTLLTLCIFITMPARFTFLVTETGGHSGPWYFVHVGQDDFAVAAALVTAALVVFSGIYIVVRVALRHLVPPAREAASRSSFAEVSLVRFVALTIVALVVFGVGAVLYIQLIGFSADDLDTVSRKRSGVLGATLIGYLFYFTLDVPLILLVVAVLAATGWRANRPIFLAVALPLLFFACLFPFLSSVRAEIILVLAVTAMAYYLASRRIPLLLATGGGVAAFFAFAAMSALRNNELRASFDQLSFLDVGIRSLAGSFNLGGFAALAYARAVVPEILPYQDGWTIWGVFLAFVPRAIWPAKPQSMGYTWIEAFGVDTTMRQGGGALPGLMGEGLLNFGLAGPAVVMAGYALILAAYYHFGFLRRRPGLWGYTAYVVFLPAVTYHLYGYELSKGLMEIVKIGLLLLPIWLVLRTRRPTDVPVRSTPWRGPPEHRTATSWRGVAGRWATPIPVR